MNNIAVEMRNITKIYQGVFRSVVANQNVNLRVNEGELHVIVGENGAGKSTLMETLYGLIQPDNGEIWLYGDKVKISNPRKAIDLGIGMIHQHFMLVPSFTIGENIILGNEPAVGTLLNKREIHQQVLKLSEELGFEIDPDVPIWKTSVGIQQRVEILKALYRGAKILILDEPTAVLTPQEVDVLFKALTKLRDNGSTLIMITHKLPEVMAVADRVTVMRDGSVVACKERSEVNEISLAEMMIGRTLKRGRLDRASETDRPKTVLKVSNLNCYDDRKVHIIRGVSFDVKEGEILAIAGVAHNGQDELVDAIMGERAISAGEIRFEDQIITGNNVQQTRSLGIGHIQGDRYGEGCAREASVAKNLIMGLHNKPPLGNRLWIRQKETHVWVDELVKINDIRLDHPEIPIMSLSGGNVQKAIVAREMTIAKKCLIAEQPSRGVDIGAAEAIYEKIMRLRDSGVAILLVSMDLTEVMMLADRILVIYNGQIVGECDPVTTTQKDIGMLMAGIVN